MSDVHIRIQSRSRSPSGLGSPKQFLLSVDSVDGKDYRQKASVVDVEEERRFHPSDPSKMPYTFEEFLKFKDGNFEAAQRMWHESAPRQHSTSEDWHDDGMELRVHPDDPLERPYTFKEFVKYQGGDRELAQKEWEQSSVFDPCDEKLERRAHPNDRKCTLFTFWQFLEFSRGSRSKAERMWDESAPLCREKLDKMMSVLKELPEGSRVAVVTMRGSLCPITLAHVESFIEARRILCGEPGVKRPARLESFGAVFGFFSLNGDGHVLDKLREKGETALDIDARRHLVELATSAHDWLSLEASEGLSMSLMKLRWPRLIFVHFYMNGADDVVRYQKYNWSTPSERYITMGRPGFTDQVKRGMNEAGVDPEAGLFILGPELQDISSTDARRALKFRDHAALTQLLHASVMEFCLKQGPYTRSC